MKFTEIIVKSKSLHLWFQLVLLFRLAACLIFYNLFDYSVYASLVTFWPILRSYEKFFVVLSFAHLPSEILFKIVSTEICSKKKKSCNSQWSQIISKLVLLLIFWPLTNDTVIGCLSCLSRTQKFKSSQLLGSAKYWSIHVSKSETPLSTYLVKTQWQKERNATSNS